MRILFNFFILFLLISCKSEPETEVSAHTAKDTTVFQKRLNIQEDQLRLNEEAREYALNWVEFITAQNEIEKLDTYTISEVKTHADAIAQIMQSLKTTIPDSLKSTPSEARLNVVNTKAQLLKQYAAKRDPDAEAISRTAKELYTEFNNLKLQMNEIFLKTLEDFEKELDEFEADETSLKESDSL